MLVFQIVIVVLMVSAYSALDANPCPPLCMNQPVCNPYLFQAVFGLDSDGTCRVFQNECFLKDENCDRSRYCLELVKPITRKECTNICDVICTDPGPNVCGHFRFPDNNGGVEIRKMTLSSPCELEKFACLNGFVYDIFTLGVCPSFSGSVGK